MAASQQKTGCWSIYRQGNCCHNIALGSASTLELPVMYFSQTKVETKGRRFVYIFRSFFVLENGSIII